MNKKLLPLLLVGAVLAAPVAVAQGTGISISGGSGSQVIDASGTTLSFDVTLGCVEFVTGASQEISISLETSGLPDYFNPSSDPVTFAPGADCLTAQEITQSVDLKLSPGADAWAYVSSGFKVIATDGADLSAELDHDPIQIAYIPGHTMETSVAFPYEYTEADAGEVVFDIALDISANGNTMVMFENVGANGTVNNLFHQIFNLVGGEERSRNLTVTWTPPAGAWEEDVISFYTYSHCLDGPSEDCGPTNEDNVTWVIKNMAASGPGGEPADEGSPGVPFVLVAVALVAIALLRRR